MGVAHDLTAVIGAAELILGVDCVGVLLIDEDDHLRSVASSGPAAAALERAQLELGVGPGVDTVRTSETVAVNDLLADGYYGPLAREVGELGVRAVVSAPVWVNGAVAGNLNVMRFGAYEWSLDDISAAEAYADVVASLLQVSIGRATSNSGESSRPETGRFQR